MRCLNCGALLTDSVYCANCGCDNSAQRQAVILSGLYYNQGLEKAQIRDLSGAIDMLKRALKFNKLNVPARNLLGLVYFETGEVVAALSEWVISKNTQPEDNPAAGYIADLQKDAGRLDVINQTIKKFNIALTNSQDGNEDVAMIQLKKILAQNPKLIKGYHLLALLYMRQEEYERARKILRKALQIDRTNTTTLRYLKEIEEQTGVKTQPEGRFRFLARRSRDEDGAARNRERTLPPFLRERRFSAGVIGLAAGVLIGLICIMAVIVPASRRRIMREANEQIVAYSSETAELAAELENMNARVESAQQSADTSVERLNAAVAQAASNEQLVAALQAYYREEYEETVEALASVNPSVLSAAGAEAYQKMADELDSELFAKLKENGMRRLDAGDLSAAVSDLTRASEINSNDEDLMLALSDAKERLAEQQKEEGIVAVIPPQEG